MISDDACIVCHQDQRLSSRNFFFGLKWVCVLISKALSQPVESVHTENKTSEKGKATGSETADQRCRPADGPRATYQLQV